MLICVLFYTKPPLKTIPFSPYKPLFLLELHLPLCYVFRPPREPAAYAACSRLLQQCGLRELRHAQARGRCLPCLLLPRLFPGQESLHEEVRQVPSRLAEPPERSEGLALTGSVARLHSRSPGRESSPGRRLLSDAEEPAATLRHRRRAHAACIASRKRRAAASLLAMPLRLLQRYAPCSRFSCTRLPAAARRAID